MNIQVNAIAHWFPGTSCLFSDLSFDLHPGYITGITGPSGCGKTTLLSLLADWEKPKQGVINRTGIHRISWVFQNPYGIAYRTALDHVALPRLAFGATPSAASTYAYEILVKFGIQNTASRPFSALSGGEAQRLMLARALSSEPDLLLVDEPTAQLDTNTASEVTRTLCQLSNNDVIVVLASHDPSILNACDQIITLTRPTDHSQ